MSIELVMPSNHLILCCPLLLPASFPASGSFPRNQIFALGGQSIGASASVSVLPVHLQDWFPLGLTGLILQSKGLSQESFPKALILQCSAFFVIQLSHPYMTTGKAILLTRWTFVSKVMSLLFNMLSQFSSVQFSCSVMSWLCDPMDYSTPGLPVHHQLLEFTQTCPLSRWCYPTISSSVVPFSSHLQSFPASGSFQMSQLF